MSNGTTPWITVAATDLNDYLVAAQACALQTAALASGQANPWTNIMTDVVNEIRSAIRGGCIKNQTPVVVSETPLSIPPELKRHAMALIAERMQMRIPQLKLTEDQKKAADDARRAVERIQVGIAVVTMPPDPLAPDDQQRSAPTTIAHADRRRATNRQLRGL